MFGVFWGVWFFFFFFGRIYEMQSVATETRMKHWETFHLTKKKADQAFTEGTVMCLSDMHDLVLERLLKVFVLLFTGYQIIYMYLLRE